MTVFRRYKVQPEGRNKYGGYYSKENVRSNLTYSLYNGNLSTEVIPSTGGGNQNTGSTKQPSTFILFLVSTQGNFNGEEISVSAQTSSSRVVSYENSIPICSYIANFSNSADTHSGITGYAESGMTIEILNNGTSASTIQITVDSGISKSTGTLFIPCYVPNGGEVGMEDSWIAWKELYDEGNLFYQELEWNWSISSNASSSYMLDLTNEISSVNCDVSGNVVEGAILPTTQARLFYGDYIVSGATYSYEVGPAYQATGIEFNTQTGVLSFTSGLSFEGTTMVIAITGHYGELVARTKTFTLNKNIPGRDGQSGETAVSKWLVPSVNEVIYDKDTSVFTPSSITCEVWMQEGGDTPIIITSAETVYYRTGLTSNWEVWDKQPITIASSAWTGVYFGLATPGFILYETEDVPIIMNGARGPQGPQGAAGADGLPGASVRGPVDWYSGITSNRRFSNGLGPQAIDTQFIDILLKDGTYYKCTISYNATPNDSWSSVSSAWTATDAAYNFVATEVLLAQNAKINFQSSNALYLMSGNTVTGGAIGGSGETTAFWAGSSNPNNAPFKVDHNGKLVATNAEISGEVNADSGTFAGFVRVPYKNISTLDTVTGTYGTAYYAGSNAYLSLNISDPSINNKTFTVRGYSGNSYSTETQLGPGLYLPKPSASLNGFTYRILVSPALLSSRFPTFGTADPVLLIGVLGDTVGERITIDDYYHASGFVRGKIIGFYGGYIEITCMLDDSTHYRWVITNCTGAISTFGTVQTTGGTFYEVYEGSISSIYGYSYQNYNDIVKYIWIDSREQHPDNDTMYIKKTW